MEVCMQGHRRTSYFNENEGKVQYAGQEQPQIKCTVIKDVDNQQHG